MSNPNPIPHGWGEDLLTDFIEEARQHAFGVFTNLPRESADLQTVDGAFHRLISGWMDPDHPHVAMLIVRAFSAFRAAAQLAMSGQVTEAYAVARLCLEHGLYGNLMEVDANVWGLWINRGDSAAARRLCARAFAPPKLFEALRRRDTRLGNAAGDLYELTIDFGAHPNELGALSTMEAEDTPDGGQRFEYSFLSGDGLPLRLCLKSVTQIGLVVLDIAQLSFPLRCKLARIDEMVAPLKARY